MNGMKSLFDERLADLNLPEEDKKIRQTKFERHVHYAIMNVKKSLNKITKPYYFRCFLFIISIEVLIHFGKLFILSLFDESFANLSVNKFRRMLTLVGVIGSFLRPL